MTAFLSRLPCMTTKTSKKKTPKTPAISSGPVAGCDYLEEAS